MTCPLCTLERKTKWLYEDKTVVVLMCETCGVPMMVLRRHTENPTATEMLCMERIREKRFPDYRWRDIGMRRIREHYHWHLVGKETC